MHWHTGSQPASAAHAPPQRAWFANSDLLSTKQLGGEDSTPREGGAGYTMDSSYRGPVWVVGQCFQNNSGHHWGLGLQRQGLGSW